LKDIADHMAWCPRCVDGALAIVDGKDGACRTVCAGTEGSFAFDDLGIVFDTGCRNFAHARHQHCKQCRCTGDVEALIPNQKRVCGVETQEAVDGQLQTFYIVECAGEGEDSFEVLLPRTEVKQSLLRQCEQKTLPKKRDHGLRKRQPTKVKGSRVRSFWKKSEKGTCQRRRIRFKQAALAVHAASGTAQPEGRYKRTERFLEAGGDVDPQEPPQGSQCGVDKEGEVTRRRRRTGGILTCVLSCGLLVDWLEMWRGEQLELVYIFCLRVFRDLRLLGHVLLGFGYDNASKLLALARARRDQSPPLTAEFADSLAFILDNFHRQNHTWCLQHMPEVGPKTDKDKALLGHKHTEACEQYNSWITARTRTSLEMPPGRFAIYWWTNVREHNRWLGEDQECLRRWYARGRMKHNPDVPRSSADK
jgi:hypothetical protein